MALKRRARKDEDKQERREAILAAALECFGVARFADVKMSEIAERAGLAKGTVFLYFPTKEALFLTLLEARLSPWFDGVDRALEAARGTLGAAGLAKALGPGTLLSPAEPLTRLLTLLHVVLEQNVAFEQALRFKEFLRARFARTGALLEARLPFLGEGGGARLLLQINGLLIGLKQMADPAPVVKEVLARPEMRPLAIDFATEFASALEALLIGWEQRRKKKG